MSLNKENTTWENFWKKSPNSFNTMMEKATDYFSNRYNALLPVEDSDVLLDYGCGPGNFIKKLKNKNADVIGVDISENYINLCKNLFVTNKNYHFFTIDSFDYEELGSILNKFDVNKVVVLSVLQYFPNEEEIFKLLNTFKNNLPSSKKMEVLIADILPEDHSMMRDGIDVLLNAIKRNYFFTFVQFIFFTLFQSYSKNKENGLLHLSKNFFEQYGMTNNVEVQFLEKITLQSSRYSVLLKY